VHFIALFLVAVLDIKFKARGYLYAGTARPGILGRSGQIALVALPDAPADFYGHKGFKVVLVNGTKKAVTFDVEDLRVNIVREARDAAGRWRPIEYLPHSWCGLSYRQLDLRPGRHWTFRAPVYQGPFKTQMRFVLDQPGLHLVSNEFSGTINLEQFDRKQGHSPVSIMDPYDD
jgi:hypothetical protein